MDHTSYFDNLLTYNGGEEFFQAVLGAMSQDAIMSESEGSYLSDDSSDYSDSSEESDNDSPLISTNGGFDLLDVVKHNESNEDEPILIVQESIDPIANETKELNLDEPNEDEPILIVQESIDPIANETKELNLDEPKELNLDEPILIVQESIDPIANESKKDYSPFVDYKLGGDADDIMIPLEDVNDISISATEASVDEGITQFAVINEINQEQLVSDPDITKIKKVIAGMLRKF